MGKEQQALNPAAINGAETEEEIDLVEVFYLLWGHILQIIACFLAGALLAFGFTYFFVTPMYQASASIYIVSASNNSIVNLTDLQIGSQLTKDYSLLITSRPVLTEVVDNLDLNMDYKALKNCITVTNQDDTRILQIAVQYPDAKKAKDIVDELSNVASEYIGEQMEVTPPKIIETGEVSTVRSDTSVTKTTAMGILLGMLLCAGVVVVRALMDDTIRSEEDIEKYLGLSTLSVIPDRKDYINGTGKKKSKK